MSLARLYRIFRLLGYTLVIIGMVMIFMGRNGNEQVYAAGFLSLALGFASIFATYVIYVISRLRRGPK